MKSRRALYPPDRGVPVDQLLKSEGGPYIGPRGGKWADPQHTVPWKDPRGKLSAKDLRNQIHDAMSAVPIRDGKPRPADWFKVTATTRDQEEGEYRITLNAEGGPKTSEAFERVLAAHGLEVKHRDNEGGRYDWKIVFVVGPKE